MTTILYEEKSQVEEIRPVHTNEKEVARKRNLLFQEIIKNELKRKEEESKRSKALKKLIKKSKYNAKYLEELKSIESVKYNGYVNRFIHY